MTQRTPEEIRRFGSWVELEGKLITETPHGIFVRYEDHKKALSSAYAEGLEDAAKVAERQTGCKCFWCGHEIKKDFCKHGECVADAILALKGRKP